ncbi:MAG: D-glycero-beta-D-manno-heptose 1-phosphate adenylyltransferase [Planctomycetota bacterium]
MYEKLLKVVTNLGSPRILVAGDFMLDLYVYGDAERISPEAPVPILKVVRRECKCGGAASVAANLAALGAKATCLGVVGNDQNGCLLRQKLLDYGVNVDSLLILPHYRTTCKERIVGLAQHKHPQQLMRIDEESTEPLPDSNYTELLCAYKHQLAQADVVCLQDYGKAVLPPAFCAKLVKLARDANKTVLVDPSLRHDFSQYKGASVITPNRKEAGTFVGFQIDSIDKAAEAARYIGEKLEIQAVIITLDKEGAYLRTAELNELIPTVPRSVYDVTGAGDMVLATVAVALAAGCDYKTAVQLANIAGGIEVEKFGAVSVDIDEIVNEIISLNRGKNGKIRAIESLLRELDSHRRQGQKIVFTNGCFDVLHRGHIEYLKFTKAQGDIVVLGLNSDSSVRGLKGEARPINNQHDRAAVLAAMESVDYIVIFEEPDPLALIKQVKPDVLVKGEDWADKGVIGREFVESQGGRVVLAPMVNGKSSTSTIEKIKSLASET